MAQTITLDAIPDCLGGWDRALGKDMRAWQQQGADEQNAERDALIAQRAEDLERILAAGNLREFVFWAKRANPQKAETIGTLLWEALEADERLQREVIALLFYASEGCDCERLAKELRKAVVRQAAENEVSYDL